MPLHDNHQLIITCGLTIPEPPLVLHETDLHHWLVPELRYRNQTAVARETNTVSQPLSLSLSLHYTTYPSNVLRVGYVSPRASGRDPRTKKVIREGSYYTYRLGVSADA